MKILHVNTHDIDGGAARAVYRLHKSLLDRNIDSQILVQNKSSDDYNVINENNKIKRMFYKLRPFCDSVPVRFYKNRSKTLFSPSWFPFSDIVNKINEINPDIVHLHWIANGMIKIEDISQIKAPIVWSFHDMWAFTGGCHYDEECKGYEKECGNCKILESPKQNDLSRKVWLRKQKVFSEKKMVIIGLSKWLTDSSKRSTLMKNKKHVNLPNPIDTNTFKPFDKEKSRELWNLPKNKKLVLFGALGATSDPRKGFKELSEALQQLTDKNIEFVVFGSSKPKETQKFDFHIHYLGRLHDDVSLLTLYSAVDVMIVPSLQEAFGQTASESMSCGTPVVSFAHTGLLDIVEHKKTGYLAKPFDTTDLKDGIEWILNNPHYDELCQNAREKVIKEFDSKVVSEKYLELYQSILK